MASPEVRRRSSNGSMKRTRIPSGCSLQQNRRESDCKGSFMDNMQSVSSKVFDSGINDSDLELAELDLSGLLQSTTSLQDPPTPNCETSKQSTPTLTLKEKIRRQLEKNTSTPHRTPQRGPGQVVVTKSQLEVIDRLEQRKVDETSFYGLPRMVLELLEQNRGIKDLYAWQHECLSLPAVEEGRNLVYSLPTSGGKTLVAEVLIFKEMLCHHRDALFILPFVSIVQEKVRQLAPFGLALDFLVEEYAGSRGKLPPTPRRKRRSVYVATIEKAHSIVNSLIEEKRLDGLGLVVVDELHMIGEGGQRGAILEMTMTKVKVVSKSTRIIGMSATLSNIKDLITFLNAELYTNDFRPVELKEYVKMEETLFEIVNRPGRVLAEKLVQTRTLSYPYTKQMRQADPDQLAGLVSEIIPDNSCLIFCPTKRQCENLALNLVNLMPSTLASSSPRTLERADLLESLTMESGGEVCPVLQKTVPFGVAYHHSGLTQEERRSLEDAYLEGVLCLLCCTSTLAAGVNLPAKRVILRSPYVGSSFLSASQYKQMVGRAGRAGLDTAGESVLILKPQERKQLSDLLDSTTNDACFSSLLYDDGKGLRQFLLSVVALEVACTLETLDSHVMQHTLLHVQGHVNTNQMTRVSLQGLLDAGLVTQVKTDDGDWVFKASQLGRAAVRGSLDLDRASHAYADLSRAQESLNMTSYLHLLYLATPYDLTDNVQPDWTVYFERLNSLTASELAILGLIGFTDAYIAKKASGMRIAQKMDEFPVRRFYLTLMLYDLWRQQTVWSVAQRYRQPRGLVQQLIQSAATLSACLGHFVLEFAEFWSYQSLLPGFTQKLSYCVTAELVPLMELPGVKRGRAKQLYDAGYRSVSTIANADPELLVKCIDHMPRRVARQLVASARMLLQERVESLREEADQLMLSTEVVKEELDDDKDMFA